MEKRIIICLALLVTLLSCKNGNQKEIESLSDCFTSDSLMRYKIPSYMVKTKEDSTSVWYEGNNKLVLIMRTAAPNQWDMTSFAQVLIGDNRKNLTLVEKNDSLMVFEIQKGAITLPAYIFSVHERDGNSVLLTTLGLNATLHKKMGDAIFCTSILKENENENLDLSINE